MLVLVHTDSHITGDDRLKEYTEEVVQGAMDRFGNRITRVEVQFSDQDSREKTKGDDKRCVLEARLAGMHPLSVSHDAHKVELRSFSVRPEKCCAGAAASCTPPWLPLSHQSNSWMRSGGTPMSCRRLPTPSGTK